MARSVWKGPFVEESLIKKVDIQKKDSNKTFKGKFVLIVSDNAENKSIYNINI